MPIARSLYNSVRLFPRCPVSQVALVVKNLAANVGDLRDTGSVPGSGRFPGGGHDKPATPVFWPGESHGQSSLVGCGPQGRTWLDTNEAT